VTHLYSILSSKPYASIRAELSAVLEWGEGKPADPALILSQPGWTLHEYDFARGEALLLHPGEDIELFTAAFSYQRQVTTARQMLRVPFETFIKLCDGLAPPQHFVHLFNIGHCGSTLLHQVINEGGEAWSLSEPKYTVDLAINRHAATEVLLVALARAGLNFLSHLPHLKDRRALVLKHFSQATKIFDVWAKAAPSAANLFMYREAISWCNSRYGFLQRRGLPFVPTPEGRRSRWQQMSVGTAPAFLEGVVDLDSDATRFVDLAAASWCQMIGEYQAATSSMPMTPIRYDHLLADPVQNLRRLFAACQLSPDLAEKAQAAFAKDSHEGELSSRSRPVEKFNAADNARILEILSHPKFNLDPKIEL